MTREFASYPELDDVPRMLEAGYDVIIVELDSDPEHALDLVEHICGNSSVTVMVYSAAADSGAAGALHARRRARISHPAHRPRHHRRSPGARFGAAPGSREPAKKACGKLLVFRRRQRRLRRHHHRQQLCRRARPGVRSKHCSCSTSIFRSGDAALDLGITPEFSTANALQNFDRLDSNFLSKLLIKHSSGLSVLAAPDRYTPVASHRRGGRKASDRYAARISTMSWSMPDRDLSSNQQGSA